MKVNIGKWHGDIIPVTRWEKNYTLWRHKTFYIAPEEFDRIDRFVYGFLDRLDDLVRPINRMNNNRKRKIKIRVDYYDVWSADQTIAMLVHPILVELKKHKQGSPTVDPEDVPENLRPTVAPSGDNGYIDDTHHERWAWVLDEMIWAFEQAKDGDYNEDQFSHNIDQLEMKFEPLEDKKGLSELKFNYQKDPSKPAYFVDSDGKKSHHERINNGLRLFAKYYRGLWD